MKLAEAQDDRRRRGEDVIAKNAQVVANLLCDELQLATSVPNFKLVTPKARGKLSGLIAHYRKDPHPFTSCVRDNTKRFGADRAKKVCAVLTDLEKGTTKWRSGGKKKAGAKLACEPLSLSDVGPQGPEIDEELFSLLAAIGDIDYRPIIGLEEVA